MTCVARGVWLRVCLAAVLVVAVGAFGVVDTAAQDPDPTTDDLVIRGTVRDFNNISFGIAGAQVVLTVLSSDSNNDQTVPQTTTTQGDGSFEFAPVRNAGGQISVIAIMDGYTGVRNSRTFDLSDANDLRDAGNVTTLTLQRVLQPVPGSATTPLPQDDWLATAQQYLGMFLIFLVGLCVVVLLAMGVIKVLDKLSGTQSKITNVSTDGRSFKTGSRTATTGNQALTDETDFSQINRKINQLIEANKIIREKVLKLGTELTRLKNERKSSPGSSSDPSREARGGTHRPPDQTNRRQILVEYYNTAMAQASPADRKQRFEECVAKTIVMGVENSLERRKARGRDIASVYKTSEAGSYLLIEASGAKWHGVPILHQPITENMMGGGGMEVVFECEDYEDGVKQRVTLKEPAEFSKKGQDLWQLDKPGVLTFSNG